MKRKGEGELPNLACHRESIPKQSQFASLLFRWQKQSFCSPEVLEVGSWGYPKNLFPTHLHLGPVALHELHYAATSTQGISSQERLGKSMQIGLSGIAIASIQQIAYPETFWLFLKDCFVFLTQEKAFRKLSKLLPPTYVGSCSLLLLFILHLLFTHKCCSSKYSRTFFSSSVVVCCQGDEMLLLFSGEAQDMMDEMSQIIRLFL